MCWVSEYTTTTPGSSFMIGLFSALVSQPLSLPKINVLKKLLLREFVLLWFPFESFTFSTVKPV